ncbi:MAG: NAD(P)/FAD-dependent oxidoreductase [Clostridia bacterium]|nr:NAD(P)/FAD-dependent oxidoreductase [Clostridia bacterium]
MVDVAIIGGGPAGIAAALNVQIRNRTLILFSKEAESKKILRAKRIDNYPGMPGISGGALSKAYRNHIEDMGIEVVLKPIDHVYAMGDYYVVTCADEMWEAKSVILATGVNDDKLIIGEEELVGQGVSYCATCDGRLYKGGSVMVIAYNESAYEEAGYLSELASVTFIPAKKGIKKPDGMEGPDYAKPAGIRREGRRVILETDQGEFYADCAFIFRNAIAPASLVPGIDAQEGCVKVNRDLSTNLPGLFAAGDITGAPYQIAKAVGEGATAGLSAVSYVNGLKDSSENGG